MQTKSVMLTEDEIRYLIAWLGSGLYTHEEPNDKIKRINYLNKRLKAFKEPEVTEQVESDNSAARWGSNAQS